MEKHVDGEKWQKIRWAGESLEIVLQRVLYDKTRTLILIMYGTKHY